MQAKIALMNEKKRKKNRRDILTKGDHLQSSGRTQSPARSIIYSPSSVTKAVGEKWEENMLS